MLLAALAFAAMAVCVKFASGHFNSAELVFWRGALGVVVVWLLARHQGVSLRTNRPGMHVWRSVIGVASLSAWFYAIAGLPLATAMTLNYMSSVWVAAFLVGGSLVARLPGLGRGAPAPLEHALTQGGLVLTVLAGFAGVVLMLRPTIEDNQIFAGLIGLGSGFGAAFAFMQVMALARVGEPETRTVFYFAIGTMVAGAAALPFTGVSPWSWTHAVWLLPIGVLATLGQWCMTRAYGKGATLVVANLQYSGIVFGAIFGLLLFDDRIDLMGWLGMGLIVASGIASTVLRARAAPDSPHEDH